MISIPEKTSLMHHAHLFFSSPKELGQPHSFKRGIAVALSIITGIATLGIIHGSVLLYDRFSKKSPESAHKTKEFAKSAFGNNKPLIGNILESREMKSEEQMKALQDKQERMEAFVDFFNADRLKEVGIFRLSGNAREVENLMAYFAFSANAKENEEVEPKITGQRIVEALDSVLIHNSATLFKKFIKSCDLFDRTNKVSFVEILESEISSEDQKVDLIKQNIMKNMPEEKRNLLKGLLQICADVIKHTENNKMNSESLAIVLGPNLFEDTQDLNEIMKDMMTYNQICKFLIDHREELFPSSLR